MLSNALISDFMLTDNIPQYQNQTWSGETITRVVGVQYYSVSFKVTMNKKKRAELSNFYAQYAQGKPFDMPLGWWGSYTGSFSGTIQVTAAAAAGATTIAVTQNTLEVGSLVQFNGHKKLYKVVGNNGFSITLFPGLTRAIQTSEVLNYENLQGSFILTPQNASYQYPSTNVMEVTIQATENIRG